MGMKILHVCTFALLLTLLCMTATAQAATIYVDHTATGNNDGMSWTDAFNDLQAALATANSGDEIWVAAGLYRPGADRLASFVLQSGVAILGGFSGSETSVRERDLTTNETILSCDLADDDGPGEFENNDENCYHVLIADGVDETAILDGFTITGGNADGSGVDIDGGGMRLSEGNPTVRNCLFKANFASDYGGGVAAFGGAPTLINCRFIGNFGAVRGGGMFSSGPAVLINCLFTGGQSFLGGGLFITDSAVTLTHCTISDNRAELIGITGYAGGVYMERATATLNNTIVVGNYPTEVFEEMSTPLYNHTMIDGDPRFVDPAAGDFRLAADSPAIDAGDSAAVPEGVLADLDGRPRFIDMPFVQDTGSGSPPTVDLGAYELPFAKNRYITFKPGHAGELVALRVSLTATGLENGSKDLVGQHWWVQAHDPGDPDDIFRLGCTPHFQDWANVAPVIHAGDKQILPDSRYRVEAVTSGGEESDALPVSVSTALIWGDVVGPKVDGAWTLPDGVADQSDIDANLECFQLVPGAPPLVACDVDPAVPNALVNATDLLQVIHAGPNRLYPFAAPAPAVGQNPETSGTCLGGRPAAPAAEPVMVGKNRYISFEPPGVGFPVALRVTLAATDLPEPFRDLVGQHWWVREQYAFGGPGALHRLGTSPHYRNWGGPVVIEKRILSPAPEVIHVGDIQIFPDSVYWVQAIREDCSIDDEALFSHPLTVATSPRWGDTAGPKVAGVWTPPDGLVDANDSDACLELFQGAPSAPPLVWCDIASAVPNALMNVTDLQHILLVTGRDYPFAVPEVCEP